MIKNRFDLFKKLKINQINFDVKHFYNLDHFGYTIIRDNNFFKKNYKKISKICNKLIQKEGSLGGWEGKEKHYKPGKFFEIGSNRLGNLINKNKIFKNLIKIPEILLCAEYIIKEDFKVAGLNLREPKKGFGHQNIHIDGFPRRKKKDKYAGIVCFFYLDDSNINNGAMRVIPKSHKIFGYPDEYIDIRKFNKHEKRIIVKAGTIVVVNLNLWHGGAINKSGKRRKVIMLNIKSRKEDQLINYKKYLSKKVKNEMNDEEKYLLSLRNNDPVQKMDSGGSANDLYRTFLSLRKNFKYKKFYL